jgi:hypothetical protein
LPLIISPAKTGEDKMDSRDVSYHKPGLTWKRKVESEKAKADV